MMARDGLTPAELAAVDQAVAHTRAHVLALADRAAVDGPACCDHPLCPGLEVLEDIQKALVLGGMATLASVACAALRLLGEERQRRAGAP